MSECKDCIHEKKFIEIEKTDGDSVLINIDFISAVMEHTLANGSFGWTKIFVIGICEIETYEPYEKVIEKMLKGE